MPTPISRVKLKIVRGLYANLYDSQADLEEGELCYATDYNKLFIKEGGLLVEVESNLTESLAIYIKTITGTSDIGEPMGHVNKDQSTLSFDNLTRRFTIQPASNVFEVWCKGIKYSYVNSETLTIPNTSGFYFIYFDHNGSLQYRTSYFDWPNDAPTAYIYWNAVTGTAEYFGDERHGIVLDWQTHEYLHRTRGAVIASGFTLSEYTINGDGSQNSHAEFNISGGTFFDEDLHVNIVNSNNPAPNTWQQDLNGPARIPVLYLEGLIWVLDEPSDFALKFGSTYPTYNLFQDNTWNAEEVPVDSYLPMFVIATNNLNYPVMSVMGQGYYSTIADAENIAFSSMKLTGFPSTEFRVLYRIIYQIGNFGNAAKARIRSIADLREIRAGSINLLDSSPLSNLFSGLKSITIQNPEAGDVFTLFRCSKDLNIEHVTAIAKGSSDPSVTIEIRYDYDLTNAGTVLLPSQAITNLHTGQSLSVQSLPVPSGSYLWLKVIQTSGIVNEFNLSLQE